MDKEIYWSRFAPDFEERNAFVVGETDLDIVKQRIAGLANLGHVLELGCGPGTYSKILSEKADHIWATDFSDAMVAVARQRFRNSAKVTVEKQNCFETSYEDRYFDTIIMVNLLHIIPEPQKALLEAKRIMKPGGRILVVSFTTNGMRWWDKLMMIQRYLRTYGKPPESGKHLDPKTVRDLLLRSGFSVNESILIGNRSKAVWARGFAVG